MITMLLGGLWHGASWTFVVWGGLHGLYLVLERGASAVFGAWKVWRTAAGRFFLGMLTFGMVCFAWVFFRAPTFDKAFEIITAGLLLLPQREVFVSGAEAVTVTAVMTLLLLAHWTLRNSTLEEMVRGIPTLARGGVLGALLLLIAISPGEDRAFIYFQF
jgi:D-alanyl-lipoteichoic acid acyltransferase DltB (MBOAT superfamily)